ncbi:hypothetical protein Tco_0943481 [Tanacetum coccineum]
MSLPNLECFKFKIDPDPGDLASIDPGICKNVSTTNVNVQLGDDQSPLFAYVVWIFLAFLMYLIWNFHEIQCLSKPLEGKSDDDFIFHLLPPLEPNEYRGRVRACDSLQNKALRWEAPLAYRSMDCPDSEDSRALSLSFIHEEFLILGFIWESQYPNLID